MKKPLIIFDLETTGVNLVTDKIVQISTKKIFEDGREETKNVLLNPTIPIPKEASDVHGITDDDVKDKPTFKQVSKSMYNYFFDCDIIGYNSDNFDIPLLSEEFNRCEIIWPNENINYLDVYKIEKMVNSHTLVDTYKRYTGKDLEGAHDAENDVNGTWEVLLKQLEKYNLPDDISEIKKLYNNGKSPFDIAGKMYEVDGIVYWSFGKNKDKPVTEDQNYSKWFLSKDFPNESKLKLEKYLDFQRDLDR